MINNKDIIQWLLGSFPVSQVIKNEVKFPCPICNRENFYFNVKKKVGVCHHAKCKRTVFYKDLLDIVGTEPETAGYIPRIDNKIDKIIRPVFIPDNPWPVIGEHLRDQWLVDTLINRGLSTRDIIRFAIQGTQDWVYVPVYEEGKLVQYVGRRLNRNLCPDQGFATEDLGRRYDYYTGTSIHDYFFGWDQCKNWTHLTLVENTFNSIWLRDALNCTTPFGSYISPKQIDKIAQSKIQKVTLIFDEGAEKSAQKSKIALENAGIEAKYIKIKGQPDDHTIEELLG